MSEKEIPIVITADLVRELRNIGKPYEAHELILAQQNMVKSAKKEELANIKSSDRKKERFQNIKSKSCTLCGISLINEKYTRCDICRNKVRLYNKKYREKNGK